VKYLRRTTSAAAGNSLGTTIRYLQRSTSGAAGNGWAQRSSTYLRCKTSGAAGDGLGTTIKYLRRTTSAAAKNGLGYTTKYLVNLNAGAGNNWVKAHIHNSWARTQKNPP
jgi:hypothetical protein